MEEAHHFICEGVVVGLEPDVFFSAQKASDNSEGSMVMSVLPSASQKNPARMSPAIAHGWDL